MYQPSAPPPSKKSQGWLYALIGCAGAIVLVLALGVGCVALLAGGTEDEPDQPIAIGEAGRVGDWEVTVTGVETASTYGDEVSAEEAQGEFKIVGLKVTNAGAQEVFFDSSAVRLEDDTGNEYAAQTTLTESDLFLEQINPGNTAEGEAVVDVPQDAEVTQVVIEDAASIDEPLRVNIQ